MTRQRGYGLIAVLAITYAAAPAASAQPQQTDVVGVWSGIESYTIENIVNGQIASEQSFSNVPAIAQLTLPEYNGQIGVGSLNLSIGSAGDYFDEGVGYIGPTSLNLSFFDTPDSLNFSTANITATYAAILPDGQLELSQGGYVQADITVDELYGSPYPPLNGTIITAQFSALTVPEPSSIALAASGMLTVLALIWARWFLRRTRQAVR